MVAFVAAQGGLESMGKVYCSGSASRGMRPLPMVGERERDWDKKERVTVKVWRLRTS